MKFEIGKVYYAKSLCDSTCVFKYKVIKRTAKRITLQDMNLPQLKPFIVGIKIYEGDEISKPQGNYSMSPTIKASRFEQINTKKPEEKIEEGWEW